MEETQDAEWPNRAQSYWWIEGYVALMSSGLESPEPTEAIETEPGEWAAGQRSAAAQRPLSVSLTRRGGGITGGGKIPRPGSSKR